ncbi:hypothetical protein B0J14DRAFT_706921 [Halenospora varia]|nr:hypothetical protein B0J14DRAFT_706921 [Halenospora varia]
MADIPRMKLAKVEQWLDEVREKLGKRPASTAMSTIIDTVFQAVGNTKDELSGIPKRGKKKIKAATPAPKSPPPSSPSLPGSSSSPFPQTPVVLNSFAARNFSSDVNTTTLLILERQEDPEKDLTMPEQPRYVEIPHAQLMYSSKVLQKVLMDKYGKILVDDYQDRLVHDPRVSLRPRNTVIAYLDGILSSKYVKFPEQISSMNTDHRWAGFLVFAGWLCTGMINIEGGIQAHIDAVAIGNALEVSQDYFDDLEGAMESGINFHTKEEGEGFVRGEDADLRLLKTPRNPPRYLTHWHQRARRVDDSAIEFPGYGRCGLETE